VLFMVWSDTKKKLEAAQAAGVATMAPAPAGLATDPQTGSPHGPPSWWQVPGGGGLEPPARHKLSWPQRPKAPRPPRSYIAPATMSAATVVGGLLWVVDRTGTEVTFAVALAILLGVVGLGLLAGAFLGRARLLILPALLLTGLLAAVTTITVPLSGPSGERTYTPTTVAAVPASYRLGVGDLDIDLRELDLGPDRRVTVHAQVGAGQIQIWVPKDVTVMFSGRADVGDLRTPDGSGTDGFRPKRSGLTSPIVEPSRGTITLDTKVGLGQIEVLYGDHGRNPR
jgi:cell wall-active antibiotic response 4TMS protein YvqF